MGRVLGLLALPCILLLARPCPSHSQQGHANSSCQSRPTLYDQLVTFSSPTPPCSSLFHGGCNSLSFPTCDNRFTPVNLQDQNNYYGSCNTCAPGYYLPSGPTRRLCSTNGGPGGVPAPYYAELRACIPCRTVTGICTIAGQTLEQCTQVGRTQVRASSLITFYPCQSNLKIEPDIFSMPTQPDPRTPSASRAQTLRLPTWST